VRILRSALVNIYDMVVKVTGSEFTDVTWYDNTVCGLEFYASIFSGNN